MGVGAGLYMYVVVVQKFTFAISSPDEFLYCFSHVLLHLELFWHHGPGLPLASGSTTFSGSRNQVAPCGRSIVGWKMKIALILCCVLSPGANFVQRTSSWEPVSPLSHAIRRGRKSNCEIRPHLTMPDLLTDESVGCNAIWRLLRFVYRMLILFIASKFRLSNEFVTVVCVMNYQP